MKKKELIDIIQQKEKKYFDLVWYARSGPENDSVKEVKEARKRIESAYPKEVEELTGEHSDWQHGFNSGMLAGLRYILTMDDLGKEQADEEFPMLDS